jgi:hypothetical protein
MRTATYLTVKYPRVYEVRRAESSCIRQDRLLAFAEVPIDIAALHEFARDCAHRADNKL